MVEPALTSPPEFKTREGQRWARDIQQFGRPATETSAGTVKQAAASANASASAVSVDSADIAGVADLVYDVTEQDMLNTLLTLVNELKADVNELVTDVNAMKDSLNDLKAKERTAGQLAS